MIRIRVCPHRHIFRCMPLESLTKLVYSRAKPFDLLPTIWRSCLI
jgi:hypothetical protein